MFPVGVAAILLTLRLVPESRADATHRLDLGGVALVSVALMGVLFPLMQGQSLKPWMTGTMVLTAAWSFVLFVRRERSLTADGSGVSIAAAPRLGRRVLHAGAAAFAFGVAFVVLVLERQGIALGENSLILP